MRLLTNSVTQNVVKRFLPLCLFTFLPATVCAQTFTQNLQKQVKGEGIIIIYQDKEIENLVNGPHAVKAAKASASKKQETKDSKDAKDGKQQAPGTETARQEQPQDADTLSLRNHTTVRVTGYRVQVYAGGNSRADKRKAEQIGTQLKSTFPAQQVYVHFYSPRWICRIGNFTSREEAEQLRNELRGMGYDSATIVKGKITLQE